MGIRYKVNKKLGSAAEYAGRVIRHQITEGDREGMPFNRAQMEWIKRASGGANLIVSGFGSSLDLQKPGTPVFQYRQFKSADYEALKPPPLIIGPYSKMPYTMRSIFNSSAMSFGAVSNIFLEALSLGSARGGFLTNTGEGGLTKYHLKGRGHVTFQIGTAKYGVRDLAGNFVPEKLAEIAENPEIVMIEIKLSQGAKPGKGGILPALKVTEEIAEIRGIEPFKDSISPPDHAEIYSVGTLLDFIAYVRDIAGKPVGFKTADISFFQELCDEIKARGAQGLKGAPDFITIDGGEGGTGAAPMALMDNVALSIRETLPQAAGIFAKNNLKERMPIIAAGKLVLPGDVSWAFCAGANGVNSARAFMMSVGCMQTKECHQNTCPMGIATQDPDLLTMWKPQEKESNPVNYHADVMEGVGDVAHSCAVPHARALRAHNVGIVQPDGRTKLLDEIYPDLKLIPEFSL